MMKKLTKKYLWILAAVVVVGGAYFMKWNGTDQNLAGENVSPNSGLVAGPVKGSVAGSVVKPVVKKSTAIPTPSGNYTALVKEYEGRRIQFDERCQITPQSPTYKNGTSIMLDNRSASVRTVMVGATKYDLVAYGYRVVTLSSSSLPKELAVSCGSSGNVGKVLLQAQILQ